LKCDVNRGVKTAGSLITRFDAATVSELNKNINVHCVSKKSM